MESKYKQILGDIRKKVLLADDGKNTDYLSYLITTAVKSLVDNQGDGPTYPRNTNKPISKVVAEAEISNKYSSTPDKLLKRLPTNMQGSVKASNPYMVKNIIPQPSFVYLAAYVASSLYMGNAVTGEDSGEALKAELSIAAALSKLAGGSPQKSSGVFTFGGTATNYYAIKIGLSKLYPDHMYKGISEKNAVIVGNKASHYCQQTAAGWLGIGQDSYNQVKTNTNQTTDLADLKKTCEKLILDGKKIACIEAVGGTTSNMAIDDIEEVSKLIDDLVAKHKLSYRPHLHVDSVLGWVWLNFVGYDFRNNPLGFGKKTLRYAETNALKISKLHFADSWGVDFHKTGYTPYNSSMVIVNNKKDFDLLKGKKDIMTPLFHDDKEYNPGIYTIETSRSCANILATWVALNSLGKEGYQSLMGHALDMRDIFVQNEKILNESGFVIENRDSPTVDVFLRCVKTGKDVIKEHQLELDDDEKLAINTEYTNKFFKWFIENYKEKPFISFSKSSASFYNHNGSPVVALRIYLLSANNTKHTIQTIIDSMVKAKKMFDKNL